MEILLLVVLAFVGYRVKVFKERKKASIWKKIFEEKE